MSKKRRVKKPENNVVEFPKQNTEDKSIIPFDYEGQNVRVVEIEGEPWWVAKDVCDVLGIVNPTRALDGLDADEKSTLHIVKGGPDRNIVNEPGLYSLILRSRKPEAKAFKRWITHEVIPQIRKTGSYSVQHPELPDFTNPAESARAWADQYEKREIAEKTIEEQSGVIAELKPKAEAYDDFIDSESDLLIRDVAKMLAFPGIGGNKLYQLLRSKKIIQKNDTQPYKSYIDKGWFIVRYQPYTNRHGSTISSSTTYVLPKGIEEINKLLKKEYGKPTAEREIEFPAPKEIDIADMIEGKKSV